MTALLHDIGCPNAKTKYGNTTPVNQEREGKPKALEMLASYPISEEEKLLIADVVGLHHHHKELQKMGYELLVEADLIVNLLEGYYNLGQAAYYFDYLVTSRCGRDLYRNMFLKN
jgi:hypothetical protein